MLRRLSLTSVALTAIFAAGASPAAADHHLMSITEVFGGVQGRPNVQFVELQMYAVGQRRVQGSSLHFLTQTGADDGTFTFPAHVALGDDNATVLIATADAAAYFGVTPDLTMSPVIDRVGGKVEFVKDPTSPFVPIIDAFSWGSFGGSSTDTGTPFAGSLPLGLGVRRDVAGGDEPGVLDANDDTNDSAADFDARYPTPRNNAGQLTSTTTVVSAEADNSLTIDAAPGVKNSIAVSSFPGGVNIIDYNAPITFDFTAGDACTQTSVRQVQCEFFGVPAVQAELRDQNDKFTLTAPEVRATVNGGTGNDSLTGGLLADALFGGDGNDTLVGSRGDDDLNGNIGNDVLDGGFGAEDFDGGTGNDTVSYASRGSAVTVTMNAGVNDDGSAVDTSGGIRDNVGSTIEWLVGGTAGDTLTGSTAGNRITGGGGADQISGKGGPDTITTKGDGVADNVLCGSGADILSYDNGLDTFPTTGPEDCETANP